jgi:BMFP domain-containing protein YqiC
MRIQAEQQLQQVLAELDDPSANRFQRCNEVLEEVNSTGNTLQERLARLEKKHNDRSAQSGAVGRAADRTPTGREILTAGGSRSEEKKKDK